MRFVIVAYYFIFDSIASISRFLTRFEAYVYYVNQKNFILMEFL